MSVRDALDDYARRMDTDGVPHVAFVIEGHGFDAPRVRVLTRSGKAVQFERMRSVPDPDGAKRMTADWTIEDLDDCARFFADIAAHLRFGRYKEDPWATAVPEATTQRERRRDFAVESEMKKAAHLSAHPFICPCGERWKTERGMKQHQRACWMIDPLTGGVRPNPLARPVENSDG